MTGAGTDDPAGARMTPPVFVLNTGRLHGHRLILDGPEGRHAATVRRIRPGERIDVTDGAGTLCECVVAATARDALELTVVARRDVPPAAPQLVVVQALPKGDGGESAVTTMTEVGVDVVVPWAAARCIPQWRGERGERALARWRAAARAAAKQARRARFPDVTEPASTADVVERLRMARLAVVLHASAAETLAGLDVPAVGEVVLVIGPEGGIAEPELAAFIAAGASVRRLGPTVLRTSTAGGVAAAVVLARTPRWR